MALFTREQKLAGKNKWLPTTWVQTQITSARTSGKRTIALVEPGVQISGLFADNEHIPLDLENSVDTLLQLSETIRGWKESGQAIRALACAPRQFRYLFSD